MASIHPARTQSNTALRHLMRRPQVAWPTLALWGACLALEALTVGLALTGLAPLWAATPALALLGYLLFTPMHDSAHQSVGASGWLNALVGHTCALVLLAPFEGFRFAHLRHHKHTNEEGHDPDLYSGGGRAWSRPLRWLTQDLHYIVAYLGRWQERPVQERRRVLGTWLGLWALVAGLCAAGFLVEVLLLWVVPARLAVGLLAFLFDYLPHRPHRVTSREDRYRATCNFRERWLTPLMMYQNYHLIHHLYPGVPFYRYAQVWRARRETLEARGARPRSVFGPRLWGLLRRAKQASP